MDAAATEVLNQLTRLVRARTGDQHAAVSALEPLPGHAGFSYSFELARSAALPKQKLVLRLAPPGVKIAGPADIVRQARIMESLRGTAVPVPRVLWSGDEPEYFGRPYFVVEFLEGVKLSDAPFDADRMKILGRRGIATLAALHQLPWEPRRDAFGDPQSLAEELARLDHLLDRPTLDPAVVARAPELRERLRATLPTNSRIGCVHGDFQFANILYDEEKPIAVIDWEIASIGPTLIDLGWVSFFADAHSWIETDDRVRPLTPEEIFETYAASVPFAVSADEVRWFRSFAGYRFGVITCFNLMLHRRGKRDDPHWEEIALSAPRMFERGLELLG
ncbi:MAG TPA: phosphotransferase family protein [Candidatus Binataceae bacterium]|jgi:aminoglycoside phosphotransferase (APT) family kinase protein|nr:phosphotransferase family protein [Candidatus Binataceae bacterium]